MTSSIIQRGLRSFSKKHSGFTLTELIVVITILSILSVIGFSVMSHQSSVARDGKRISDIKTLSESARITSAQLRKLPTPIADSISLTVSGSFIGYQGFMSLALVNPLGYGSDKIFDPKDNIPYTYRVNQHYDQAQFLAYLENPRFERTIEIAKQSLPSTLPSMVSKAYAFDTAYALDSSSIDLSKRYPYSAGDRLGIFLSKGSKQPLQNGVSGTGSRDISLSDASTLDIIVGSQGADEYVSTDISTGSLNALKSGTFDEKALLEMNETGTSSGSGSGSGSNNSGNGGTGGSSSGYILTMGEYTFQGQPMYGYMGPGFASGPYSSFITTITAGDLTPKTLSSTQIDSVLFFQGMQLILLNTNSGIAIVQVSEGSNNADCELAQVIGSVDIYACTSVSIAGPHTPGEIRVLGIESANAPPVLPSVPTGLTLTPTDSQVSMTWNNANNTDTYTLAWNVDGGSYTEISGITGTGYAHTGLTNGAYYCYKVRGINVNGISEYSPPSCTAPDTLPAVPTNVSASGIIANSITLSWDALPDGQASFDIEYSMDGVNFMNVGDFSGGGGTRQYAHNGLVEGTTYYYRIRATKSYGVVSAWSDTVSAIVIGTPTIISPANITNAPINIDIISNVVTASHISSPVLLTVSGAEFRVNGGSWVTSANINNGDQVEYKTVVTQDGERKIAVINFNGVISEWKVDAYSCFSFSSGTITSYNSSCQKDIIIPRTLFGQTITSIGFRAFQNNQLTSVVIPDSVTSIGNEAFQNNQLTSVVIPDSVTSIGSASFAYNQLTSVVIPDSVTSMGWWAFAYNQLTSVVIPDSVTSIGDGAFNGNQLTSVVIPYGVAYIGSDAFAYNQLTSVVIPDSVTSIGDGAFKVNQLTSVVIPDSVTGIYGYAFHSNQLSSVVIPDSVIYLGNYAFGYNQLGSITISNNLIIIGDGAFTNNQLASVVIPDSVTSIGWGAFQNNQLASVVIPDSVTSIGWGAFQNNQLTSVMIPNSVTNIGSNAFGIQTNSPGNGTVYGPASGYVKDTYNNNSNTQFDKGKLPNYVDLP